MDEQQIHQKIGQILYECGPVEANKIIVRAELFAEGDGSRYEFDYVDKSGKMGWFAPDGRAVSSLTDKLLELRKHQINSGLCLESSPWRICGVELDILNMKITINVRYES